MSGKRITPVHQSLTFSRRMAIAAGAQTAVGALLIGRLGWLSVAENGTSLFGWHIDLPSGTAEIVVGVLMATVLILRPSGLTNGRELRLRGVPWRAFASRAQV